MKTFIVSYDITFKVTTAASLTIDAESMEDAKVKALAVPKGILMSAMLNQYQDQKTSELGLEYIGAITKASEDVTEVEVSATDIIEPN